MLNRIVAVFWATLIAVLSLLPNKVMPKIDWDMITPDKAGHFAFYGVLCVLVLRAAPLKYAAAAAVSCALYGVLMEYLQFYLTPDRMFEYPDMLANAIGCAAAYLVMWLFTRKKITE